MDCRTVRTLTLSAPPEHLSAEVQSHVAGCAACRDELGELHPLLRAPVLALPPPELAQRVLAALPAQPPAVLARRAQAARRRRRLMVGVGIAILMLIVQIGLLGVFVDSAIPARIAGGPQTAIGRLLLLLTMAAKPLASTLGLLPLSLLLAGTVGLLLTAWLWLRLLQSPVPLLVEVRP